MLEHSNLTNSLWEEDTGETNVWHMVPGRNNTRETCVNCRHGKYIHVLDVLKVFNVLNILNILNAWNLLDIGCIVHTGDRPAVECIS